MKKSFKIGISAIAALIIFSFAACDTGFQHVNKPGQNPGTGQGNAITKDDLANVDRSQFDVDIPTVDVDGVSLDSIVLSATYGDPTQTLTATVSPNDATNQSVSWSSDDLSVATVSGGIVTFVGAGNAIITVTTADGSFTDVCHVTVDQKDISFVSVTQNGGATATTNTTSLTITFDDDFDSIDASNISLSVSGTGWYGVVTPVLLTSVGNGEYTLTVTFSGQNDNDNDDATITVTVIDKDNYNIIVAGSENEADVYWVEDV